MALFVLILVGVVVAQTWLDWRDAKKAWVIPEWAKGMALGGLLAVSLAATSSVATVWLREDAGQWTDSFSPASFGPNCSLSSARWESLWSRCARNGCVSCFWLAGVVIAAFWLGMSL